MPDETMKLSEAMRLGAMIRPQCFNELFANFGLPSEESCALGAAIEGAGLKKGNKIWDNELPLAWKNLLARPARCPICHGSEIVHAIVVHLNNEHHWTRERIATEFVEPIERQLEANRAPSGTEQPEPIAAELQPA